MLNVICIRSVVHQRRFVTIARLTCMSTLGRFSVVNRYCRPIFRKTEMLRGRLTDYRHKVCRWPDEESQLFNRLFKRCLKWRTWPPTQKTYNLNRRSQKWSMSAKKKRLINCQLSPKEPHVCIKNCQPLAVFGNVSEVYFVCNSYYIKYNLITQC